MLNPRLSRHTRFKGPALALAVLVLVATLLLWLLDIGAQRESLVVNLLGTLVFITAASILIAAISIRSFLRTGAWPVLWLGAGSLAFGLAVPLSNAWLALFGSNAGVTTHNLGALVAAILHCLGAFFTINRIPPHEPIPARRAIVRQVYAATLLMIALITLGAALNRLPPFFIQGQGGTPLRQLIVAIDALLFFLAGLVFARHYALTAAPAIYWYALGLMLTALGLAGILMISATGTPLNWLGRISQWIGGLYLLAAALITRRDARARGLAPDEVLAGYFLRSETSLRRFFDSMGDAIVVTDQNFNITFWNRGAEAIYGWRGEEVIGQPAADVIRTEWNGRGSRQETAAELRAGRAWEGEAFHRHRNGRAFAVQSTISPVRDEAGRFLGAIAVNRDITARRAAEEEIRRLNAGLAERAAQLEASNRELEAFAYSVSHDLRAPLRGIAGYAEALDEDCGAQLDDTGREYLRLLRQNAGRMSDLIDDLLALSRVGRQQVERVRVDMAEVARAAWAELAPQLGSRRVEFTIAAMPPGIADPTLVKQVYANLLSNALKFTRPRDCAIIDVGFAEAPPGVDGRAAQVGPAAAWFVRDNGIGFDMAHAGQVFGLFQRLHRPEEYEGTGVGLAIVQRIVERHGGRVWAAGEPGRGATFYFTLGDQASGKTD